MRQGVTIGIAISALFVGFGAGFIVRPIIVPAETAPVVAPPIATASAQPTEQEATEAVRRHRVGLNTYSNATLTLGDCSAGGLAAGVTCAARVTLDPTRPNATPQNRSIGFARIDGQWEVSLW